jgi:hypothetical protein
MAKHVLYDVDEFLEKTKHEFEEGMNALDCLESEIRASLDRLTAMQFHNAPRTAGYVVLPTASDHAAADLLAQELAGRPSDTLT